MNPNKDEKDISEQQELDHYEEGNTWLEEAKRDMTWVYRLQNEAQTMEERRVSQFLLVTLSALNLSAYPLGDVVYLASQSLRSGRIEDEMLVSVFHAIWDDRDS